MSDEWMERTTQHMAITCYFTFMIDAADHKKCIAMKDKETGDILYVGDKKIPSLIGPAFKTLQEACFYDFGKDMEDSLRIEK